MRAIFEKEPFGDLERLVTRTFLSIAKGIAKEQLQSEEGLRLVAKLSGRTSEQVQEANLDSLNADRFGASVEACAWFLEPLIELWDIDLKSFGMDVVLSRNLVPGGRKRFDYVETKPDRPLAIEPGLQEFLGEPHLSADVTDEELAFLSALKLDGRRPTPVYYYRELQNLRDPLHFRSLEQKRPSAL